jgi:hypothetical protein
MRRKRKRKTKRRVDRVRRKEARETPKKGEETKEKEDTEDDEVEEENNEDDVPEHDEKLYGTPVDNLRPIQRRCLYLASSEQKIYEQLRPMQAQGKVPIFFSSINLMVESLLSVQVPQDMPENSKAQVREYLRIPGALISFIGDDAFPARTLKDHTPPKDYMKAL